VTLRQTVSLRTRAATTEERIVAAAQRLVTSRGAAAVSMRDVATDAGITIGAIYRHFRDRDALLERVIERVFSTLETHLLRGVASCRQGSFDRVIALGSAYITFAQHHAAEFDLLFSPPGEARPLQGFPARPIFDLLRSSVGAAIDDGEIRADPDLVAFLLWSRVHGIIMLLRACDFKTLFARPGKPWTPAAAFEATQRILAEGLRPPPKRATTKRSH
jgi:AcrR family transcriptional regulator